MNTFGTVQICNLAITGKLDSQVAFTHLYTKSLNENMLDDGTVISLEMSYSQNDRTNVGVRWCSNSDLSTIGIQARFYSCQSVCHEQVLDYVVLRLAQGKGNPPCRKTSQNKHETAWEAYGATSTAGTRREAGSRALRSTEVTNLLQIQRDRGRTLFIFLLTVVTQSLGSVGTWYYLTERDYNATLIYWLMWVLLSFSIQFNSNPLHCM